MSRIVCIALLTVICFGWVFQNHTFAAPDPYNTVVLADNPWCYWRLNETSGTNAADSSPNNQPGTYAGSMTMGSTGLLNGDADLAVDLSGGSASSVNLYTNTLAGGFTAEMWVRFDDKSQQYHTLFNIGSQDSAPRPGFHRAYLDTGWKLRFKYRLSDGSYGEPEYAWYPVIGRTYHCVFTHDYANKVAKVYIDGKLVISRTHTLDAKPVVNERFQLGTGAGGNFIGVMDELAVYTTALSAERVNAHFRAGKGIDPTATAFYASPTGSPNGNGTITDPLDLASAFDYPLPAGGTLYLRGGTYNGAFTCRLKGTPGNYITIRSYPGEWAVIDRAINPPGTGQALDVDSTCTYVIFRDFEVMNSDLRRVTTWGGVISNEGLYIQGPYTKAINLVVHDNHGDGIGSWVPATANEVYGCIIYNNGTIDIDRPHGHGFYIQNSSGVLNPIAPDKFFKENVSFNPFYYATQVYFSSDDIPDMYMESLLFEGNVYKGPVLYAGSKPMRNIRVNHNFFYKADPSSGDNLNNLDLAFTNNILYAGTPFGFRNWQTLTCTGNTALSMNNPQNQMVAMYLPPTGPLATFNNNTYYNGRSDSTTVFMTRKWNPNLVPPGYDPPIYRTFAQWQSLTYDVNSTFNNYPTRPTTVVYEVRPNAYQQGRAHIVVWNWPYLNNPANTSVTVSLANSSLVDGQNYQIRDGQNYLATPLLTGTYNSANPNVILNLAGLTAPYPITDTNPLCWLIESPPGSGTWISNPAKPMDFSHSTPEFGVFVVIGAPLPIPSAPTGLTATPGNQTVALAWNITSGATSYNIKRSLTTGGTYATVKTGQTTNSYTNTALTNGITYYYVVSAVNAAAEEGPNSSQADATPYSGDIIPPTVLACSYDYLTATHKVIVQFSEDVSGSLSNSDLSLVNLTTGSGVVVAAVSYDAPANTATFTFAPTTLPDGNFRATFSAVGITDASGNHLDGNGNGIGGDDYLHDFFFVKGDANHDRHVDIVDLGIVGTNWQQSPRNFTQGDFDYSGMVDIVDLGIVGTAWQTYLAPPSASSGQSLPSVPLKNSPRKRIKQ